MDLNSSETSAGETLQRFGSPGAAARYAAASLPTTPRGLREERAILAALEAAGVAPGASLLDLPCGAGRLLRLLVARGLQVTAADASPHMLERAKLHAAEEGLALGDDAFHVADVLETGFADGQFDAVVCNRLFHHFREPEVRRRALAELLRICRGPIIASFFSSRSLDAWVHRLRQGLRRRPATDRIAIAPAVFEADARAVGLRVSRWVAPRPGISRQCYAVLVR